MRYLSKVLIAIAVIVIIGAVAYTYVLPMFEEDTTNGNGNGLPQHYTLITETKPILNFEGNTSVGTLFCQGEVVTDWDAEEDDDVDYILLIWKADVTFPGDFAMGELYVDMLWGTGSSYEERLYPIGIDGGTDWTGIEGDSYIWTLTIKTYDETTEFKYEVNNQVVHESTREFGILSIEDGTYEIFSIFECMSDEEAEEYMLIETTPFNLVRDSNDFWFE